MNCNVYSWADKLPDESLECYEPNLKLFFETMYERQKIWVRRFIEKKPRPWSDNPILANHKFTNVYRELDRSSQFLIHKIMIPMDEEGCSDLNMLWKMMVYRTFNNPETFSFEPSALNKDLFGEVEQYIPSSRWRHGIPDFDEYDEDEWARFIDGVRANGKNPFTNAYLINSSFAPQDKRDYAYTHKMLPILHSKMEEIYEVIKTCEEADDIIDELNTLPSVHNFISHEYYQDLTYLKRYTKRDFMRFDQNDYTNVGPGASIGIRLIFPNLQTIKDQKQAIYHLQNIAKKELAKISEYRGERSFPFLYWNRVKKEYYTMHVCNITLHQIEMWLCEFQKYWKMMIGEGKQRSKFVPKTKIF